MRNCLFRRWTLAVIVLACLIGLKATTASPQAGESKVVFTAVEWEKNFRRALDALRIDAHLTMHRAISRFFRDPRLVQLFDRYATYNGSSPFRAPATLCMIPYIEIANGGWYIKGGLYRLVEALLSVIEELGVNFQPGCEVSEILVEPGRGRRGHGRAVGVRFAGGGVLYADEVIVNADPLDTVKVTNSERVMPPFSRPHRPAAPRCLRTPLIDQLRDHPEQVDGAELGRQLLQAILDGRGHEYLPFTGQSAGLIRDIVPAAVILARLLTEADAALRTAGAARTAM